MAEYSDNRQRSCTMQGDIGLWSLSRHLAHCSSTRFPRLNWPDSQETRETLAEHKQNQPPWRVLAPMAADATW